MSQIVTDFSEYTIGANPHDWTWTSGVVGTGINVQGGDPIENKGGKYLRATGQGSFAWDTLSSYSNFEAVSRFNNVSPSNQPGHMWIDKLNLSNQGTGNRLNGYIMRFTQPNSGDGTILLSIRANDNEKILAELKQPLPPRNVYCWCRFRVNGIFPNVVMAVKTWRVDEEEPFDWTLEYTTTLSDYAIWNSSEYLARTFSVSGTVLGTDNQLYSPTNFHVPAARYLPVTGSDWQDVFTLYNTSVMSTGDANIRQSGATTELYRYDVIGFSETTVDISAYLNHFGSFIDLIGTTHAKSTLDGRSTLSINFVGSINAISKLLISKGYLAFVKHNGAYIPAEVYARTNGKYTGKIMMYRKSNNSYQI